jgi:hypothetical protein
MDGFDESLIVPKFGAFNEGFRVFDCPKWMGLMKG